MRRIQVFFVKNPGEKSALQNSILSLIYESIKPNTVSYAPNELYVSLKSEMINIFYIEMSFSTKLNFKTE